MKYKPEDVDFDKLELIISAFFWWLMGLSAVVILIALKLLGYF